MKRLKKLGIVTVTLLSVFIFTGCGVLSTGLYYGVQTSYDNPQWAPPYYSGARYYYLPDIESYYDLSTKEFIFLNNGQWCYSTNVPSSYANYDLNSGFAIVLDVNVYRPWMHHQYYVSHYPRYYYRDYYDHSNIPYVRGFNENSRGAIYWKDNERNRARSWDDKNLRENRQFKYSKDDRQQQRNSNGQSYNRPSSGNNNGSNRNGYDNSTRRQPANSPQGSRSQSTNYYGKTIGNSVKVSKQMRNNNNNKGNKSNGRNSSGRKSSGRR